MSVHPSRLANIPQGSLASTPHYSAPPVSASSVEPSQSGTDREADLKERVKNAIHRSHDATEGAGGSNSDRREGSYARRDGQDRDRRDDRRADYRDRERYERDRDGGRGRDYDDRGDNRRSGDYPPRDRGERRASPSYAPYDRREDDRSRGPPPSGPPGAGGWQRQSAPHQDSGFNGGGGYGGRSGGGGPGNFLVQGPSFLADRRKQRDANPLSIWPPSPKGPASNARDKPVKTKHSSKKSSRKRRTTPSDTDSDSSDRRYRRHKEKSSRSSRHKSSSSRQDRSRSRRRSSKKRKTDDSSDSDDSSDEEEAVIKSKDEAGEDRIRLEMGDAFVPPTKVEEDDDDDVVGPVLAQSKDERGNSRDFGGHLRPGEGSAMAAFVSDGQRIPRRGEIGLASTAIEQFEASGYVMSGSRHTRMNAVRMRKENQVISAEEKRGILKMQAEEKAKRESMIVANFREMVSERLEQGASRQR
ncbi:Uncharacterized conserved protein [Phaffia rhodozyma]|uniref:Uncharacterized conserved protein n=1 Tax=Phaffia rhodozyma TaxID=264483 RepID=A0A0F7SP87_PHARH|nr:Uncharacterized conserved protein [Phaffia rhodozyma]